MMGRLTGQAVFLILIFVLYLLMSYSVMFAVLLTITMGWGQIRKILGV